MMNTMLGSGVTWGWHVHLIFGGAIFLGAIFLIILAAKFMSKKELLNWAVWAVILGIIGTLLTGGWGFSGWSQIMKFNNGGGMMGWNMNSVNWESMAKDMKDADFSNLDTDEEWRNYMLEHMQEHMGS